VTCWIGRQIYLPASPQRFHLGRDADSAAVVGIIEGLNAEGIAYQVFPDAETGLVAVRDGRIDALVYDRPLLVWLVIERFSGSLQVLDTTFDPQVYAIALPLGSQLRMPVDLLLLDAIRSGWWRDTLFAYLGRS